MELIREKDKLIFNYKTTFMMRIFIVDDNRLFRKSFKQTLEELGHKVWHESANTDDETLEKAILNRIDIFFLDIEVEHENAGFDFAKRLRECQRDKNIESKGDIVYLSGKNCLPKAYEKEEIKPFRYLHKQNDEENFRKLLEEFFIEYEAQRPRSISIAKSGLKTARRLCIDKILYVEFDSERLHCKIHTDDDEVLWVDGFLKDFIEMERNSDLYAHGLLTYASRAVLVNRKHIYRSRRNENRSKTLFFKTKNNKELSVATSVRLAGDF
ncbi:MAG: response regulator [Bernardetiaceae bacterium]|nr:response regulator [Bernardetiaceae bacterium]